MFLTCNNTSVFFLYYIYFKKFISDKYKDDTIMSQVSIFLYT